MFYVLGVPGERFARGSIRCVWENAFWLFGCNLNALSRSSSPFAPLPLFVPVARAPVFFSRLFKWSGADFKEEVGQLTWFQLTHFLFSSSVSQVSLRASERTNLILFLFQLDFLCRAPLKLLLHSRLLNFYVYASSQRSDTHLIAPFVYFQLNGFLDLDPHWAAQKCLKTEQNLFSK